MSIIIDAGRLLLIAMIFFALGNALDLWVVVEKVSQSRAWGLVSAGATLALFYGLWFGYTLYERARMGRAKRVVQG